MSDEAEMLTPLHFDIAALPERERLAAWQSALSNFALSQRTPTPFAAAADIWLLDPLVLTHAKVDAVRYDRTPALIAQDLHDHFAMVYLVGGSFRGDYGEGERASGPASLTVLDMRRPCWTDAEPVDCFVLSVPRVFLMARLGDLDPHGMVVSGGLAPLLGSMLREIGAVLPRLHCDHAAALARTICDLVAETLLAAARSLADPAESRSIGELAAAYAFTDKSHLSRLFKTAHGCTPGRYRAGAVAVANGAPGEDVPDIFRRWTELLD